MQLAAEAAAAEEAEKKNSLLNDPWFAPTSRLKGRVDWDGQEYITSQQCLDALEIPAHARDGALFRKLRKLMREHGWAPIRIKLNGVDGGGVTERVRGFQRITNRLPYPHISKEFPGKIDTTTPYVIGKVVSRLEMDSRWALARSVRALVAERDALKGKLDTRQCGISDVGPGADIGPTGQNR
jgi:hypothetical protein